MLRVSIDAVVLLRKLTKSCEKNKICSHIFISRCNYWANTVYPGKIIFQKKIQAKIFFYFKKSYFLCDWRM